MISAVRTFYMNNKFFWFSFEKLIAFAFHMQQSKEYLIKADGLMHGKVLQSCCHDYSSMRVFCLNSEVLTNSNNFASRYSLESRNRLNETFFSFYVDKKLFKVNVN